MWRVEGRGARSPGLTPIKITIKRAGLIGPEDARRWLVSEGPGEAGSGMATAVPGVAGGRDQDVVLDVKG